MLFDPFTNGNSTLLRETLAVTPDGKLTLTYNNAVPYKNWLVVIVAEEEAFTVTDFGYTRIREPFNTGCNVI
jgi:hypothetical protein